MKNRLRIFVAAIAASVGPNAVLAFTQVRPVTLGRGHLPPAMELFAETSVVPSSSAVEAGETKQRLEFSVQQLKKVLEREYVSFFNPMERDYYVSDVVFQDPLTSLAGIDAYQNNVDLLSGRTLLGSLLFSDASINLHSITGGDVTVLGENDWSISKLVTRWTLRFCFKILPWKPTARFSGISVYTVKSVTDDGKVGVQIVRQDDYWDSINLQPDGSYQAVDKSIGLKDFLNQLKPSDLNAPPAGPELPYELLRRGQGYEVRRYPRFTAAQLVYARRDEGFNALGSFTRGLNPMAPAIMTIKKDSKSMMWPLTFAAPGEVPSVPRIKEPSNDVELVTIPSTVVAVARFSDASVEPVVRKAKRELQGACQRDGLILVDGTNSKSDDVLQFCQYDAIFSMGKRRGEVWIPLQEGHHPWSTQ